MFLGRGSFGKVYETGGRAVKQMALKTGQDNQSATFETLAYSCFDHDNIVKMYDFTLKYDRGWTLSIVLELGSATLTRRLEEPISPEEACNYMIQIMSATDYMHSWGVSHTDLKPENMVVVGDTIKLIDLGSIRMIEPFDDSVLDEFLVTRWYRHPFSSKGWPSVDYRSLDIFALGVIFWEMYYRIQNDAFERFFPSKTDEGHIHMVFKTLGFFGVPQPLMSFWEEYQPELFHTVSQLKVEPFHFFGIPSWVRQFLDYNTPPKAGLLQETIVKIGGKAQLPVADEMSKPFKALYRVIERADDTPARMIRFIEEMRTMPVLEGIEESDSEIKPMDISPVSVHSPVEETTSAPIEATTSAPIEATTSAPIEATTSAPVADRSVVIATPIADTTSAVLAEPVKATSSSVDATDPQTIVSKTFCSLQNSKCGNLFSVVCNSMYCFCAMELGLNYKPIKRGRTEDGDEGKVIKKQNTNQVGH